MKLDDADKKSVPQHLSPQPGSHDCVDGEPERRESLDCIDGEPERRGSRSATGLSQLQIQPSLNPFNSDHVPFIDAGIPAVLTIEGTDSANQHIHSEHDTLDHVDRELATEIVRMNVAATATALGAAESRVVGG